MKHHSLVIMAVLWAAVGIAQTAGQSAIAKQIGTIKAISGNAITLTPESGADVPVTVEDSARILRLNPGDKDLKNATPIQLQDLKVGDKVRVRGHAAGQGVGALEVLVITSSAVDAVRDEVRQDWQKRGVAGLVEAVDPDTGTVKLSIPGLVNKRTMVIHTSKSTVVHRYAPDSARSEDAKPATLADVHIDDQLRARGNRSQDGSELTAEEIYTGVFHQVKGTIKSVDASAGTLSVQDLRSKKTLQLKIAKDSQLHKVPAEMAQRFAGAYRAVKVGGTAGAKEGATPATAATGAGSASAGNGSRRMGGGGMDMLRMLDQTPAVLLSDLHKGDAVALLATEGTPSEASTVVKLFSGVEPILEAAPNAGDAIMLTPWSLSGAPGGDAMQ